MHVLNVSLASFLCCLFQDTDPSCTFGSKTIHKSSHHFFINLLSPLLSTYLVQSLTLRPQMPTPPKKNPKPTTQAKSKVSSHGIAANTPSTSTTLIPSPAFSPDFSDVRLNMRRAILRSSSSKSVGEASFDDKIERELENAERMEREWLERIKGGDVEGGARFGWVWVA